MKPIEDWVTSADGVHLFVQKVGDGPSTVLLPNGLYLIDHFNAIADRGTLIYCDPRNRARSEPITDRSKLERGIHHDVDDLEAIRQHVGASRVDLIGHSYMGLTVLLYAMKYPDRVRRVVAIGAIGPDATKQYPAHLANMDATLSGAMARLGELEKEAGTRDPEELCRKFWSILREIYVADPADADKITWEHCDLANERNFLKQWTEHVMPSIQKLTLTAEDIATATAPVLVIHGRKDRSAPYGGGRDWAVRLPNARLMTVDDAAHAPWIEEPDRVFGAIDAFLGGAWPETTERVTSLD
jgi:pimeloyl-ACP methyl ester carboxylesterase